MWIWWLTSVFLGSGLAGCAFAQCPDSRWLELSRKREWDYELKLTIVRWLIDWAWTYGKFLVWYLKFWEKLDFFGKVAIFGGWNHNSWTKAPWLCCNLFRILLKIGHDSTNICLCKQSDRWLEMNGCCCTPVSFLTSHWANSFTKPTYIVAKCGENTLATYDSCTVHYYNIRYKPCKWDAQGGAIFMAYSYTPLAKLIIATQQQCWKVGNLDTNNCGRWKSCTIWQEKSWDVWHLPAGAGLPSTVCIKYHYHV